MPENKVEFNLKNVHYAVYDEALKTFATPVAVPGAVTLSLDPEGDMYEFYADGNVYFRSISNKGYAGDLEMALMPPSMHKDIWANTEDETDHVLVENATVEPKPFALLFQIDGDQQSRMTVLYNCIGKRPSVASKTNEDGKEVQTQKTSITARPMEDGTVKAVSTASTPSATLAAWFTTVWEA